MEPQLAIPYAFYFHNSYWLNMKCEAQFMIQRRKWSLWKRWLDDFDQKLSKSNLRDIPHLHLFLVTVGFYSSCKFHISMTCGWGDLCSWPCDIYCIHIIVCHVSSIKFGMTSYKSQMHADQCKYCSTWQAFWCNIKLTYIIDLALWLTLKQGLSSS